MNVDYLKLWVRSLITEAINEDQLKSVASALNVPIEGTDGLRSWVNLTDPTQNKSYSVWLLRGLKKRDFRFEDSQRITDDINRHIALRQAQLIPDIMNFPRINDLETALGDLEGKGSKRKGFSGVDPTSLKGVEIIEERPDMTFFRVSNAHSLGQMGEGTKWCTRHSFSGSDDVARRYISQYGSLIVGYRDGKPYVQYNPDFSQVMTVNDTLFHGEKAKELNLPKPNVSIIRRTKRTISGDRTEPEKAWQRWQNYTTDPNTTFDLPKGVDAGRDLDFEKRLAKSITQSNNYIYLLKVDGALHSYIADTLREGQRVPEIEKAILEKDWKPSQRYVGPHHGKHSNIPMINSIAFYAKRVIGHNWPEFEKTIEQDPYNSSKYYKSTGFHPAHIEDPTTKNLVLFSRHIADKTYSGPQFEKAIKDFYFTGRQKYKHTMFTKILYNVLIPYIAQTRRNVSEILGPEEARKVYKNTTLLYSILRYPQNRDLILERLLLKKVYNSFIQNDNNQNWSKMNQDSTFVVGYAKNIIQGRWKELETLIVSYMSTPDRPLDNKNFLSFAAKYAISIKHTKWPELVHQMSDFERAFWIKSMKNGDDNNDEID